MKNSNLFIAVNKDGLKSKSPSLQSETMHLGLKHASREKKLSMVIFFIFVQKNVSRIRFQEIKIRPLKGFEKMRFLCFYIIGV